MVYITFQRYEYVRVPFTTEYSGRVYSITKYTKLAMEFFLDS
jgi:hypothetical protein